MSHFETERGGAFQIMYLVVTVGYLIDFRLVVLFIFQAFFSTEERTEPKKPSDYVAANKSPHQGSASAVAQEGQHFIGNHPTSQNTAQPTLRASCSLRALDSFHGSSY